MQRVAVPRRGLRAFLRDHSGNAALMFAAVAMVTAACGAFAIDEGSLYLERRHAQAGADLAAIAAAADPANAQAIVAASLRGNGLLAGPPGTAPQFTARVGTYTADPKRPIADRFVPDTATPNAVRVTYRRTGELYFSRLWAARPPTIGVAAVASVTPQVTFSIGSSLARLDGGIANAMLGQLLGASISLSAVSYRHLLGADVSVFGFLDALAQQLHVEAGTYDDLLAMSAGRGAIARALAGSLTGADQITALALANALPEAAMPLARLFALGDLGHLAIGTGEQAGYRAAVSIRDLLLASAVLGGGAHQVALALQSSLPGVTAVTARLAIGEPAQQASWFAVGETGAVARTAQIRLALDLSIAGGAALGHAVLHLPLYLDLAFAEARLVAASCPSAAAPAGSASLAARPGIARLRLGEVSPAALGDFSRDAPVAPARLIDLALLQVTASASAELAQTAPQTIAFSSDDIAAGAIHTLSTHQFVQALTDSLLETLSLRIRLLGLGLDVDGVRAAVRALIVPLAPGIDDTIALLLNAAGVRLSNADLKVYRVACRHPVLVQ